jgi:NAD(P)-dependent dehydrogenase (short-subunit alcohol dehydrogenase family)
MKLLASELETNTPIRVNSLDPGRVRTELSVRAYPGRDPAEWAKPEAILATYLYLLGPDSQGITGRTFHAQD